ncbi:helix-turn-helix domain-containing protein [Undibacterium sp. TC9W]|uniref:helix-turn-helix domain-containing protein n=1 Tax=Undibacterium sp. TC9W TaxID=3413053 RepID=UPI003BF45049
MSTDKTKELFGFGARLAEERQRLGLTQKAVAAFLDKTSMTQIKYESEDTKPDLLYLEGLDKLGADIYYIITGKRSDNTLSNDERDVITGLRSLDLRGKAGVLALISGMAPHEPKPKNVFHGGVGQNVEGNITAPQTFNIGKDK